jgi:hypothetical protein
MRSWHLLPDLASRTLRREVIFSSAVPHKDEEAGFAAALRLPEFAHDYVLHWTSEDFAEAGLRHGGLGIDLLVAAELEAATREAARVEGFRDAWLVIGRIAAKAATAPVYRSSAEPATLWVLDRDTGAIVRVPGGEPARAETVAADLDAFLGDVIIETGEALAPCSPFSPDAGAEVDEAAVCERVGRAADKLAAAVGHTTTERPPELVPSTERHARLLAAALALPAAYRAFLAHHAWRFELEDDAGPTDDDYPCRLEGVASLLRAGDGWESLPEPWIVIATTVTEIVWLLDRASHRDGDCAVVVWGRVLHPDSNRRHERAADSFVEFLEQLAESTQADRDERAIEDAEAADDETPPSPRSARSGSTRTAVYLAVAAAVALLVWYLTSPR